MQVVLDNGEISDDVKTVLSLWRHDFGNLLNTNNEAIIVENFDSIENVLDDHLDLDIDILEVTKENVKVAKQLV